MSYHLKSVSTMKLIICFRPVFNMTGDGLFCGHHEPFYRDPCPEVRGAAPVLRLALPAGPQPVVLRGVGALHCALRGPRQGGPDAEPSPRRGHGRAPHGPRRACLHEVHPAV